MSRCCAGPLRLRQMAALSAHHEAYGRVRFRWRSISDRLERGKASLAAILDRRAGPTQRLRHSFAPKST